MNIAGLETRKRLQNVGLGLVGTLLAGALVLLLWRQQRTAWVGAAEREQRILVTPFQVDSAPQGWSAQVFAESLAAQLGTRSGVEARVGSASARDADYVVDGEITAGDGRAVIAVRVRPAGQRAATWSGTFWRETAADPTLARGLAIAIAEALRLRPASWKAAGDTAR